MVQKHIKVRFIAPKRWWHRAEWELLEDYKSNNGHVTAKAGFVTDGASVPWIFRWRFSPTGKYFGAAIVHDYVLVTEGNWKKANEEFDDELKALRVSRTTRAILVGAVNIWERIRRLFGKKYKAKK